MELNLLLAANLLIDEKVSRIYPLIAMELNHFAHLFINDNGYVTSEGPHDCPLDTPEVQVVGQPLNRSDTVPALSIYISDVNFSVFIVNTGPKRVFC